MRKRWLINLLLLILVIALGALMRRELDHEARGSTLTGLPPENIEDILIKRPDKPLIHLVRSADGWRMKSPYKAPADAERIAKLVRIAGTQVSRTLPRGADAERLGLDKDSISLTLNDQVLRFGDIEPVSQNRYVSVGDQVHLIGDGFQHHLTARAENYLDRTLLPAGFQAGAGTLGGASLSSEQLTELDGLAAETVEPLGSELTGRLLSLTSVDGKQSLRFLVSADGLGWARLDQRLRYLVATPPAWAVADPAANPDSEEAARTRTDEPGQ